ncbi:MAG: NAD-glutamate dehydrogenase [Acidobacteriota bacterium]
MTDSHSLRDQRIDEVVELYRRDSGSFDDEVARFLRRYYATVAPSDVLATDVPDLLAAALSLWRFGVQRKPGEAKVRMFNPTAEEDGWQARHTVVEIVNDDMPFLVSSVTGALNRRGLTLHLVAHPTVRIERSAKDGHRQLETDDGSPSGQPGSGQPGSGQPGSRLPGSGQPGSGQPESFIHVEVDRIAAAGRREKITHRLARVLADVRAAVEDFAVMGQRVDEALAELSVDPPVIEPTKAEETVTFLRWLKEHFLFLGYREYDLVENTDGTFLRVDPDSGLGLLRQVSEASVERSRTPLSPEAAEHAKGPEALFITKTYNRSTVHRPVHMDYIGVRSYDDEGRVYRERRFIGLFTSEVYDGSVQRLPLLGPKVQRVLQRAEFGEDSHAERVLLHIFESLPRDEVFQMSDDELYDLSLGILHLQERQRLALFVRRDPFDRFVSCLVYVPRDRYNTELRETMAEILSVAFNGRLRAFDVQTSDSPLARVLFIVRTRSGKIPPFDVRQLRERLEAASLTWEDHLQRSLIALHGEEAGQAIYGRSRKAFPAAYRARFDAAAAIADLASIARVAENGELRLSVYRSAEDPPHSMRVKIYSKALRLLSDIVPMFENMGLKVVAEQPYEIHPKDSATSTWLLDFELMRADGSAIDLETQGEGDGDGERFREAFTRVWNGEVENDGFNRLVLAAALHWREVVILRAYYKYLRQIRTAFSQAYMQQTLVRNPLPARLLVELFQARFDPERQGEAKERTVRLRGELRRALEGVRVLDEDRILRRYVNLIRSTLRTNYFQPSAAGQPKEYLSLKFDSRFVNRLPEPRPAYEIFVYSPTMEGVHLRGGRVARGGIRWSDRIEDFRTEILGLVKAQRVKNAVIVPEGAKGGFVVKAPDGRSPSPEEGVEAYRNLVRGMLDITDSLDGGEVIPPPRVARHDGDDPYLVVAADKGTARFSDIANALSLDYRFWLGDAFASGGSAGYDHKAMGITARGAWESVKRHFREMGRDIQDEDFTAVGVGDMAGDVFGNGMLLSPHTRLVAAFNHLHIFVDPNPDAAASFAERKRLFELPRSAWTDYDVTVLSPGGRIFERSEKSLELTPEIQERLAVARAALAPDDLIRAILKAPVDLLWFGGIGTFVKAHSENHLAADDRHNDALRVDAPEVRAQVVGEGANLGVTQRGRIELAAAGVRLNTDAIDNSAGVDTSDHEVNIKILLADVVARGDLDVAGRNALLAEMTDEVARLVLTHNYLQTQAISVEEAQGVQGLDAQAQTLRALESKAGLDREQEKLPTDEEIEQRRDLERGFTRPELSVLLAYAKIAVYRAILPSSLPDDPELQHDLIRYFPRPLAERFSDDIRQHRLRREIIATHLASSVVNRVGPTFVSRIGEETGASAVDITRAFVVARDSFGLRQLWAEVEALDLEVPAALQVELMQAIARLIERTSLWLLRHNGGNLKNLSERIAELRPAATAVLDAAIGATKLLPPDQRSAARQRAADLMKRSVPASLAKRFACIDLLGAVCDLVAVAREAGVDVVATAKVYLELEVRFRLATLRRRAAELGEENADLKAAADTLIQDLYGLQGRLTRRVLIETSGAEGDSPVSAWLEDHKALAERAEGHTLRLAGEPTTELPDLIVTTHHLRRLAF